MKKSNTFLVATLTVALLLASCGNTPEVIIATTEPVIVEVTVAPEVSPTTTEKTPAPLPEGFENLIETYADDGKLPTSAPDLTTGYRISGATFLPGETHVGTFIPTVLSTILKPTNVTISLSAPSSSAVLHLMSIASRA
jgi:ABC-type phosphate/phosphonate transport system, periplasmic component